MASASATSATGSPREPRISYIVARFDRAIRREINARLRSYGLTTLQYTTLSVLGRREGLSNAQLARRSYMTPQSMNEVIDALERKSLVIRTAHPRRKRVLLASLTANGRRVLADCDREVDALESEMLSGLTGPQVTALHAAVLSAVRALDAGFPASSSGGRTAQG